MAQRTQLVHPPRTPSLSLPAIGNLKAYFLVTKPTMVSLLVFTGVVGFAVASQGTFPALPFLLLVLALSLGCAGANVLTGYIDRDIDAIMARTRHRPIPTSQISPDKALIFGLVLAALALGTSLQINALTSALIFLGLVNNVVMYSIWAKRRTPLNILVGSLAGGLPAVAGYAAYANGIGPEGLFLGAIVVVWIPVHIWSLALKHRADYTEANVPMLPVVMGKRRAVQFIAMASGLLVLFSLVPAALNLFGWLYLYSALSLGLVLLYRGLRLMLKPEASRALGLFKVSNLYLGLLFLSVLIEAVVA